jgi:hypothetical protein
MLECEVCDEVVQYGQGLYQGAPLSGYDIFACYECINGHHDGFGPSHSARIVQILDKKGIKHPPKNQKGWLPLEF